MTYFNGELLDDMLQASSCMRLFLRRSMRLRSGLRRSCLHKYLAFFAPVASATKSALMD